MCQKVKKRMKSLWDMSAKPENVFASVAETMIKAPFLPGKTVVCLWPFNSAKPEF